MRFASNCLSFERFCGWLHTLRSRGSASNLRRMVHLSLSISAQLVLTEDLAHRLLSFLAGWFQQPIGHPIPLCCTCPCLVCSRGGTTRTSAHVAPFGDVSSIISRLLLLLLRTTGKVLPVRRPGGTSPPTAPPPPASSSVAAQRATPPTGRLSKLRARGCQSHFNPRLCSCCSSIFRLSPTSSAGAAATHHQVRPACWRPRQSTSSM